MENQNNQNNINPKNFKKLLIPAVLIVIFVIGISGFFLLQNKKSNSPVILDEETNKQIQNTSIPGSSEFEKDNISFSYPSDYKAEEREKGFYVIFKDENNTLGEAGINIDTRRQNSNADYDKAVTEARNNLTDPKEKDIPNGVKMYGEIKEGLGKGIPTLYVFIKYGDGVIKIEHSGEILNEAVFDQVVNSIKIN